MNKILLFFLIPTIIILSIGPYLLIKELEYERENSYITKYQEVMPVTDVPKPIQKTKEEEILEKMTNREKVGQLFIFGIEGNSTLNPENKQFLIDTKVGGIILFSKNITDEDQLRRLILEIQSTNEGIPLFISIDQEGGVVSRLKWNEVLTRSQSSISSGDEAYEVAKKRGEILKSIGINMNLAPVAEFSESAGSFIYERVYRGSMDDVVEKVLASVRGYRESGVLSVLKHFPGHGEVSVDPHIALPSIYVGEEEWSSYVMSFSRCIREESIDGIMVGHILFPYISPLPASISKEIVNGRLIEELGYEGLIISDDMEMKALEGIDSADNLAKKAIESGIDILIYSKYRKGEENLQESVYDSILNEVEEGRLNIDNHVMKILRAKERYISLPM